MCGRYTHAMTWEQVHALYNIHSDARRAKNTAPRYNICPTDIVEFVRLENGVPIYDEGRWGLVPTFFKQIKGAPLINARIETVAELAVFRTAFAKTRCLIPADGYYEWTVAADKGKDPHYVHMPENEGFSFAGLYAINTQVNQDGTPIRSCTIITGPAEPPVSEIHDREPLVLDKADYAAWLDPKTPLDEVKAILGRCINRSMLHHQVGREVNSNRWQGGVEAIRPLF